MHMKRKRIGCNDNPDIEFRFGQLYKILFNNVWQGDEIESVLHSIRRRWQRTLGDENVFSAGKEFELVLLGSTRAIIHIV